MPFYLFDVTVKCHATECLPSIFFYSLLFCHFRASPLCLALALCVLAAMKVALFLWKMFGDCSSTGHWTRIRWKIQNNLIVHRTLWLWKMNERHTITPNKCNQYEWDAHQNRIEQGNSNVCSSSALFHLFCFYFSTLRMHIDELTSQTTFHFNDPFFIIYNPLHSRQNVWAAYRSIGLYDNKLNMLHAYICCSLFFSGRRKLAAPIIFTYYYDSNQIGLVHVIYSLSRIDTHKQPNAHAAIIV